MLAADRFCESVDKLLKLHNDEIKEETLWGMWLHKVFDDTSYSEFKAKFDAPEVPAGQKESDFEAIVKKSQDILDSFNL